MTDKSELQAVYRVRELAEFANTSRYLMARLLREAGVLGVRVGSTVVIPVSEVKEKIPLLWESLTAVHQARRPPEKAPKTSKTARRRGCSRERL
jgi:hypothetical protein